MDKWHLIDRITRIEHWVLVDVDWLAVDSALTAIREARAAEDPAGVREALVALEELELKQPRRAVHSLGPGVHPIGDELNERRSLLIVDVSGDPDDRREPPAREAAR